MGMTPEVGLVGTKRQLGLAGQVRLMLPLVKLQPPPPGRAGTPLSVSPSVPGSGWCHRSYGTCWSQRTVCKSDLVPPPVLAHH